MKLRLQYVPTVAVAVTADRPNVVSRVPATKGTGDNAVNLHRFVREHCAAQGAPGLINTEISVKRFQ